MAKVKVTVEGYGIVKIKLPKELSKEAVMDVIAETVGKTMTLVDEQNKGFHMAMGFDTHNA